GPASRDADEVAIEMLCASASDPRNERTPDGTTTFYVGDGGLGQHTNAGSLRAVEQCWVNGYPLVDNGRACAVCDQIQCSLVRAVIVGRDQGTPSDRYRKPVQVSSHGRGEHDTGSVVVVEYE